MQSLVLRAFGVAVLIFSVPTFGQYLFKAIVEHKLEPSESTRFLFFTFATVVGAGLICLRKWAAVFFSLPMFGYGLWLVLSSVERFPFPLNLFWMCLGGSLTLPLIVTIRIWSQLSWRENDSFDSKRFAPASLSALADQPVPQRLTDSFGLGVNVELLVNAADVVADGVDADVHLPG